MNSDRLLIFINYGSKGNSGLYLSEMISNIDEKNIISFTNYFYDYQHQTKVIRIFERFSGLFKIKLLDQFYKLIDMYLCFIYIAIFIKFRKEKKIYISISLFAPFKAYEFFLKLIRGNNTKIISTIHDAEPLYNNYPFFVLTKLDNLVNLSDMLILHTEQSFSKLSYFHGPKYLIPFPLMQISPAEICNKNYDINFLFIGHMRKEKGVDILIEAWRTLDVDKLSCHLTLAGSVPFGLDYNFDNLKKTTVIPNFLDEQEYASLISNCSYVILPYTGGTNSGILSTVISLNKPVIASSIEMFNESDFIIDELIFKSGSVLELSNKIKSVINNHENNYKKYLKAIKEKRTSYNLKFKRNLNKTYTNIFNASF